MRIENVPPGNRGWMWIVAAAIAALFPLILWGSVAPAAAQSTSTDLNEITEASPVVPNSSGLTHQVFLPLASGNGPANPPTVFGVQLYSDPRSPDARLDLMKQAGVSWIRYPVKWAWIEPVNTTPDQYLFGGLDWALRPLPGSGLNLIATMTENPSWASSYANGRIDKTSMSEFAQFMGALVERYDGDGWKDAPGSPIVDYWEFYNEPDCGSPGCSNGGAAYWGPFGAEYARMLCAVRPVMKAASPRSQIVMGGMAYDWFQDEGGPFVRGFLDAILEEGGGDCLDVMNFHYYPGFEAKWNPYGPGLNGKVNYLRNKLAGYGFGDLPMVVTEAGHHSNNYPSSPSTPEIQASYVVKLFTQALASDLESMIWWTWSDKEIADDWWGANGLLDQGLQPKLAFSAFQTAVGQIGRAVFQRIVPAAEIGGADVQAYLLLRSGSPIYVLWANGTSSQGVSLPGRSARVVNYVGGVVAQVADGDDGSTDGRVRVTVGSSPVYAEVVP